jgi:hypothetical protein
LVQYTIGPNSLKTGMNPSDLGSYCDHRCQEVTGMRDAWM